MKKENISKLRTLYSAYWHQTGDELPDGWAGIIGEFLAAMDDIGDLVDSVAVRFEYTRDGLRAYAWPRVERWSEPQAMALIEAQRHLYMSSQMTCEECGRPGERQQTHPKMPDGDHILCATCATAWQARQAAAWGDDDET